MHLLEFDRFNLLIDEAYQTPDPVESGPTGKFLTISSYLVARVLDHDITVCMCMAGVAH